MYLFIPSQSNSLAHTTLYIQKPSLRAVAQPIENFQDAAFNTVSKHVNHEDDEETSVDQTDMEMISTEVENNRSRNRRSRNSRSRNRRRRRRRSRNRRSRRNRSRRRRRRSRSRGMLILFFE